MQLNGQHEFNAAPPVVWAVLHDPEAIARALPGVQLLEAIEGEANAFRAQARLQVAAIGGSYRGELRLSELDRPRSYRMKVQGEGQNSRFHGDVSVQLSEMAAVSQTAGSQTAGTRLEWQADAQVSGLLARVGQRLIKATAQMMSKRFFAALGEELPQRNLNSP
ncbi:MAG: carbon monoxide dehydrogenase subunit G [Anaerolineaceae bacterium]|nr:carbon monoxide dehydrogenase subunit G [Anaerolineaceae bacterium]